MSEIQIQKVSRKHDEILDYFICNPLSTLKEASEVLGYTQSWLSIITNSDAYRAEYERRRGDKEQMIANDITARIRATTQVGLAKVEQLLTLETNLEKASETTDKLLKSLGFAPQKATVRETTKTEAILIPKVALDAARNFIRKDSPTQLLAIRQETTKETNFLEDIADVFPPTNG